MYLNDKHFNIFQKTIIKIRFRKFFKNRKNLLKYIPNDIPWNKYNN